MPTTWCGPSIAQPVELALSQALVPPPLRTARPNPLPLLKVIFVIPIKFLRERADTPHMRNYIRLCCASARHWQGRPTEVVSLGVVQALKPVNEEDHGHHKDKQPLRV